MSWSGRKAARSRSSAETAMAAEEGAAPAGLREETGRAAGVCRVRAGKAARAQDRERTAVRPGRCKKIGNRAVRVTNRLFAEKFHGRDRQMERETTIAAISTAQAPAGIGII